MVEEIKKLRDIFNDIVTRVRNFLFFSKMKKIKFNVGSGGINNDKNWYATDIHSLNLTKNIDWKKLLFNLRIDNIMAEHVWEHLTEEDTILANNNCYKYLKRGGILRIAVPDGFHPEKNILIM